MGRGQGAASVGREGVRGPKPVSLLPQIGQGGTHSMAPVALRAPSPAPVPPAQLPAASRRPLLSMLRAPLRCLTPPSFHPRKSSALSLFSSSVPLLCHSISCPLKQCLKGDSNSLQTPTPLTSQVCTLTAVTLLHSLKVKPRFWGLQLRLGHIGVSLGGSDLLSPFPVSQPGGRPDGPLPLGPSLLG